MSVNFNGNVTVNGHMEVFGDGSVRITGNQQDEITIEQLDSYINKNLPSSPNKKEYLDAAKIIKDSDDKTIIKKALDSIAKFGAESGKAFWISGLKGAALEVVKLVAKNI